MKRRFLAMLLTVCMLASVFPTSAFALPGEGSVCTCTAHCEAGQENTACAVCASGGTCAVPAAAEQSPTAQAAAAAEPVNTAAQTQNDDDQAAAPAETQQPEEAAEEVSEQPSEQPSDQEEAPAVSQQPDEDPAAETEEDSENDIAPQGGANDVSTYAGAAYTVTVGSTVSITGSSNANAYCWYDETWKSSNTKVATVSGGVVTGVKAGTATISHTYCSEKSYHYSSYGHSVKTETFTVTVRAKTAADSVTITGPKTVKVYDTITLTATVQPDGADNTMTWQSSNTGILTVDQNGVVTGVSVGTATVTAYAASGVYDAYEVTVTEADKTTEAARFFFLKDPTKDHTANGSENWSELTNGSSGTINVQNIQWTGANNYEMSRVLTWPDGSVGSTYTVPKTAAAWQTIYDAFAAASGITDEDDVEAIILTPYKISSAANNGDGNHVDCTVSVVAKSVYTVRYRFMDVGAETWTNVQTAYLHSGDTTAPTNTYPATKTKNGVTYTFVGWYTNPQFTGSAVDFSTPYTVTGNVDFYAKYVAGYNVTYNANGGTLNTESVYPYLMGADVYVLNTEPTRDGYEFQGWESSEGGTLQKNAHFIMPANNVVLTAIWKAKTYEIKWVVEGETVKTVKADYGTSANDVEKLAPADPTKASDAQYDYTFKGWTPGYSDVTGNQTYTAEFTKTTRSYEIEWISEGKTVKTATAKYGTTAEDVAKLAPADPTKDSDDQYDYTFKGWTPEYSKVTGNQTYTAEFTKTVRSYEIEWISEGKTVKTASAKYGTSAEDVEKLAPADPTKASDAQYDYTFKGWTPGYSDVTGNQTYTAEFTKTTRSYEIEWISEGKTVKTATAK